MSRFSDEINAICDNGVARVKSQSAHIKRLLPPGEWARIDELEAPTLARLRAIRDEALAAEPVSFRGWLNALRLAFRGGRRV